jgi:hypothetical protein
MARRNSGTYGGSASLFPPIDKTTEQKIARCERWLDFDEKWLTIALECKGAVAVKAARKSCRRLRAVLAELQAEVAA